MKTRMVVLCLILCIVGTAFSAGYEISKVKLPDDVRAKQIQDMKWGMFICWSFSTFYGHEWTPTLDKDASFFKATGCDTDQWCKTAKDAGMGYILFLAKHHDGFCLWDTKTTEKKVTNSPLGIDVLAKLKKSCDKYGIKLALYFSEGDWNWPGAADGKGHWVASGKNPEMKKAQLKELLTEYGPIEFWWMDHAAGTGGLSHKETVEWMHKFQPNTFVGFNHGQKAGRIALREVGKPGPLGDPKAASPHNKGGETGHNFLLAEFTYPILPKHKGGAMWFYSLPKHDNLCHPASKLFKDYQGAQKYGNIFSIDVGPNYEGKIRDIDVKTLKQVGEMIKAESAAQPKDKHEASAKKNKKANNSKAQTDFPPKDLVFLGQSAVGPSGSDFFTVSCWVSVNSKVTLTVGDRKFISEGRTIHNFKVDGLKPDKKYTYSFTAETDAKTVKAGPFAVNTYPDFTKGDVPFAFGALGDSRSRPQIWKKVSGLLAEKEPLFVMHSGDFLSSGKILEQWHSQVFEPAVELLSSTPMYPVIGNHDYGGKMLVDMFQLPARYWSYTIGPVHIIGGKAEKSWLEKELSTSKAKFIFYIQHGPIYSSGPHGALASKVTSDRTELLPLLVKYNVTALIAGHDHFYERSELPGGLTTITTGGAGAPLYGKSKTSEQKNPYSKAIYLKNHYCLFSINGDTCQLQVYDTEGKVIDNYTWRSRPAGLDVSNVIQKQITEEVCQKL